MNVRFWNPHPIQPVERILGPFDFLAVKVSHSGGLTRVCMVDQNGTEVAWLSTLAPVKWYLSGEFGQHFFHAMMWEAPCNLDEHDHCSHSYHGGLQC